MAEALLCASRVRSDEVRSVMRFCPVPISMYAASAPAAQTQKRRRISAARERNPARRACLRLFIKNSLVVRDLPLQGEKRS